MKKGVVFVALFILTILAGFYVKHKFSKTQGQVQHATRKKEKVLHEEGIREGDLIFQTSKSAQSKAIQLATRSIYSHCGVIFSDEQGYFVFEAIQPVKKTALCEWIARGNNESFVIKRIKDAEKIITAAALFKMKKIAESFEGKNYDLTFEWSDDKMYCSELIWKIYKRATGLEIGYLQQLKDFDLTNVVVKNKLKERYGNAIPMNETVISPDNIFKSELLTTVKFNQTRP